MERAQASLFCLTDTDHNGTLSREESARAQVTAEVIENGSSTGHQECEERAEPVVAETLRVDVRALSGEVIASVQVMPGWSGADVKAAVNSQLTAARRVAMVFILRECGTVDFGDDQTVESVGLSSSESLQVILRMEPPEGYFLRTDISCERCGFGSVYRTANWKRGRHSRRLANYGICANPNCGYEWSEVDYGYDD